MTIAPQNPAQHAAPARWGGVHAHRPGKAAATATAPEQDSAPSSLLPFDFDTEAADPTVQAKPSWTDLLAEAQDAQQNDAAAHDTHELSSFKFAKPGAPVLPAAPHAGRVLIPTNVAAPVALQKTPAAVLIVPVAVNTAAVPLPLFKRTSAAEPFFKKTQAADEATPGVPLSLTPVKPEPLPQNEQQKRAAEAPSFAVQIDHPVSNDAASAPAPAPASQPKPLPEAPHTNAQQHPQLAVPAQDVEPVAVRATAPPPSVWSEAPVHSGNAAPFVKEREAAPVSAAEPVEVVEPPVSAAAPIKEFALQLDGPQRVDLKFTNTTAGVQIAVLAADPQIAQHLNSDLGNLVQRLEQAGLHAVAGHTGAAESAQAPAASSGSHSPSQDNSQHDEERRRTPQQEWDDRKPSRSQTTWAEVMALQENNNLR